MHFFQRPALRGTLVCWCAGTESLQSLLSQDYLPWSESGVPASVRFDEERSAFAVNLPSGGGEFYLQAAAVRRADTRCVHACVKNALLGSCYQNYPLFVQVALRTT